MASLVRLAGYALGISFAVSNLLVATVALVLGQVPNNVGEFIVGTLVFGPGFFAAMVNVPMVILLAVIFLVGKERVRLPSRIWLAAIGFVLSGLTGGAWFLMEAYNALAAVAVAICGALCGLLVWRELMPRYHQ
jgi:hypothetical protein